MTLLEFLKSAFATKKITNLANNCVTDVKKFLIDSVSGQKMKSEEKISSAHFAI